MNYVTLDNILDLNQEEINSSAEIAFEQTTNDPKYELQGIVVGISEAPINAIYKFNATEGATYSVIDTSFFDPNLRVYDWAGNAVVTNSESVDSSAEIMFEEFLNAGNGAKYSLDIILEWVAPYTGVFFIKPGWEQGTFFQDYSLSISADTSTAIVQPPPPVINDTDRVFNWGENTYKNLFPEHQESRGDVFGYYARLYSNGDALGEKNGDVYYYDGGVDGAGEISLVGTVNGFLSQATEAGF